MLVACQAIYGQHVSERVLFLGNSYTYVNDLPGTLHSCAQSVGDTLVYDSNTPGGHTLGDHTTDATSISKIAAGNWSYVVLQGQSQELEEEYAALDMHAHQLDSMIKQHSPCGKTMFYMTWGYKYGDTLNCPVLPAVCTYEGMDSSIRAVYLLVADSERAEVSPVGAVRHFIRHNYPGIELYQADYSHPTLAGTYAAACTFYAVIYRKDPTLITYNPGLVDTDAAHIRLAAKAVAYDSLMSWNVGRYDTLVNPGCTTGISSESPKPMLQISPNPATDVLHVEAAAMMTRVQIYNVMGELVKEAIVKRSDEIDISGLRPGIYVLRSVGDAAAICRFVKL